MVLVELEYKKIPGSSSPEVVIVLFEIVLFKLEYKKIPEAEYPEIVIVLLFIVPLLAP